MSEPPRPSILRPALSWLLLAGTVGYAVLVHHGLGPRPGPTLEWYTPRGFLTDAIAANDWDWLLQRNPGLPVLWIPAFLLALASFLTTRSALLRTVAVTAAASTAIFLFYALGESSRFVWNFFHWRGSATMIGMGTVCGVAICSPWLAGRWLSLGWAGRLAWFVPILFGVIALQRNVTGTDHSLPFAISPWPAIPVFGLEAVGTVLAAQTAGVGIALIGLSRLREAESSRALGALLTALGLAVPALWLTLGSQGMLPFRAGPLDYAANTILCAALVLAAATIGARLRAGRLRARGVTVATAAALLAVPLFAGQAWARWDYTRTRDVLAQDVIDALASYYEREQIYPDDLETLVETGHLEDVPEPRVGFSLLADEHEFVYQAFGTSYLLEFPAPRWVQCAYNPPMVEEDLADYEEGELTEEELDGAWSCPSTPPELW